MSDATTGVLMGNGSSITQNIAADRTAKMPMKAMVTSVAGRPTPGSIRAVVVLTMQYNWTGPLAIEDPMRAESFSLFRELTG